MATTGQAEKPAEKTPKRSARFDFSALNNPTSMQTARKWAADVGQRAIVELSLAVVIEDPDNPRTRFNEKTLQEMAQSIRSRGVMQPILVRERGSDGVHIIIQGARRYQSSKMAGKATIPAIVIPSSELHIYDDYSQVIENIQRENLNAEDMFAFIAKRLAKGDRKVDIAEKLGIHPQDVSAYLAFQGLPENILALFRAGKIDGVEPLYALTRLRAKSPELADRLISDAEQTDLGEITRAMIRRAHKGLGEQIQPTETQPGGSQPELTHSSSSASKSGLTVGEGPASGTAATGNEDESSEVADSTAIGPLTREQTPDVQNIRSHEGDQNAESSENTTSDANTNTVHLPHHNPAAHKSSERSDGRKPDPDHIKKPLLLGEIDGEPVKILLTRRPTSPGLVHISREDTGFEEEVALDLIKLTLLSEMKVQETA